jgi:hypothetical protein
LHNARTWRNVPRARARVRAQQTLDVFAPIAALFNLADAAEELTNLSVATLRAADSDEMPSSAPRDTALAPAPFTPSGLTGRLLERAVFVLPAAHRHRYFQEWLGELASFTTRRERLSFAMGLNYSALALRYTTRDFEAPGQYTSDPTRTRQSSRGRLTAMGSSPAVSVSLCPDDRTGEPSPRTSAPL